MGGGGGLAPPSPLAVVLHVAMCCFNFCRMCCCVQLCIVVSCSSVCCCVLLCDVPKALLPEGNGRDVYPRVQVNGRAVCIARALCVGVWISAERGE